MEGKVEQKVMDVTVYDQQLTMYYNALEILLFNNRNLEMFLAMKGMGDLCKAMMQQPVPSDINTKQA